MAAKKKAPADTAKERFARLREQSAPAERPERPAEVDQAPAEKKGRPKSTTEKLSTLSVPASLLTRLQMEAVRRRAKTGSSIPMWEIVAEALDALGVDT